MNMSSTLAEVESDEENTWLEMFAARVHTSKYTKVSKSSGNIGRMNINTSSCPSTIFPPHFTHV